MSKILSLTIVHWFDLIYSVWSYNDFFQSLELNKLTWCANWKIKKAYIYISEEAHVSFSTFDINWDVFDYNEQLYIFDLSLVNRKRVKGYNQMHRT